MENSPEQIPLVIGHPENDLPVVGLLARSALVRQGEGDRRAILIDDQAAVFSTEALSRYRQDGYNKVSVKIKMPEMIIRHVGLVTEAAVEELNAASFAAEGEAGWEYAIFEADALFGTDEWRMPLVGGLFRGLRDWMIEKFGLDAADKALPTYSVDALKPPAEDDCTDKTTASFSTTTNTGAMTDAEKQEMEQLKAENARLAGLVSSDAEARRTAKIDALFAAPEHKGKITDKNRDTLRVIAAGLVPKDAVFSADVDPLKPVKDLLATMPVVMPGDGSVATFGSAGKGDEVTAADKKLKAEISRVTGG
ncbi:MAG: hypothetical protein WCK32_00815 [Chlorobiaceae bacterium]